jgi:hypothetical protein
MPLLDKSAKIVTQISPASPILYFYSAPFELWGRSIGQLATLLIGPTKHQQGWWSIGPSTETFAKLETTSTEDKNGELQKSYYFVYLS